jgi:hypothetical protein
MKARTKAYANRVAKLCAALPNNWIARILGHSRLVSQNRPNVPRRANRQS